MGWLQVLDKNGNVTWSSDGNTRQYSYREDDGNSVPISPLPFHPDDLEDMPLTKGMMVSKLEWLKLNVKMSIDKLGDLVELCKENEVPTDETIVNAKKQLASLMQNVNRKIYELKFNKE